MSKKFKTTLKDFWLILQKPELKILPGQIAFNLLMSFIPILLLLAFVTSAIIKNFNLLGLIESNLPTVFANILSNLVENTNYNALGILIVFYVLLALNGPSAIIFASNQLYGIEQPSFLKAKFKSLIMIFIIVILMIFMIFIPVLGNILIKLIIGLFDNGGSYYNILYKVLKWISSFVFIFINIKLLYTMAPDKQIKSKNTTVGALFTTVTWILVTELFAIYITEIAVYDVLYGNFANILILLFWIYFLSYCFVIGMAININKYKNNDK